MRDELEAKLLANRRIEDCGYETECWVWTKSTRWGYGQIYSETSRRCYQAHRVAAHLWLDFDLASPLFVLHRCDVPACFNPEHLFVGTPLDNMRDMIAKGRQFFPGGGKGEAHWKSKLTEADILRIRQLLSEGVYQYVIAAEYGVTQPLISAIARRKIWRHV